MPQESAATESDAGRPTKVRVVARLGDYLRHQVNELVDGKYPWGAVVTALSRYGVTQRRLVVFPPGITMTARRRLRLWRGWPIWGALLWFGLEIGFADVIGPAWALALSTGMYAGTGWVAFALAGPDRRGVRTCSASVLAGFGHTEAIFGQHRLQLYARTLETANLLHRRGALSTVQYESVWWQVYDAMAWTTGPHPDRALPDRR